MNTKLMTLLIMVVSIVALIRISGVTSLVTLDRIKEKSLELKQMVHDHYLQSVAMYTGLVLIVAATSIPIVVILVVAGGFLFGTLLGALYATIGGLVGGIIAFLMFRYFLRSVVEEHYGAQLARFNEKIHVYGYNYIIILHYLTVIPLFIINMCAALTPISLGHFVWITLLGSAPLYVVYALAGRELATIRCVQDIFSAQIILACALLIVVALIPMLIKRYQARH
ncbi:MAG: TVP38/TMEM64 family protein [Candidatus Babeliales bacterium]